MHETDIAIDPENDKKPVKAADLKKPFKTIDEQMAILSQRGMTVDENARTVLAREGYYPVINGDKDPFLDLAKSRELGQDAYRNGTRFEDVYRLFTFDRDLRVTMLRYFAKAEAAFKTICAYRFTEAHANEKNPYLNLENYRDKYRKKGRAEDLVEEFRKAIGLDSENKQWRRKTYLRHYIEDLDGEVPLWVLMNYASLGQAFRFYCFMNEGMQNAIAKTFSTLYLSSYGETKRIHPKMLRTAFDHIKDFRNICAHDERLYCAKVAPSSDTNIAKVIDDLKLVIPKNDHDCLVKEVNRLVRSLLADVDLLTSSFVQTMGFEASEYN